MQLHIFFTPAEVASAPAGEHDVYIIVDVIRATTSLAVIFDQGAAHTFSADSVEQARAAARMVPGRLLCGERNVQPLPGFDFGNSPTQFAQTNLQGRDLILTTTNGTRAFYACPDTGVRLAGCFYNAHAVTAYALARAQERDSNINIVCAAEHNYFALDDATCAGYLAQELQHQSPHLQGDDSIQAASALYAAYAPPKLIEYCNSARMVINGGLGSDLEFCMRYNASDSVPIVTGREEATDLLVLERA